MNDMASTASARIAEYLEGEGIAFQLLEHGATGSAFADARATHHRPETVAKTVVLSDGARYVLALVPGSERLDVRKLREVVYASRRLRLVAEADMAREFPQFEVGAVPPCGGGFEAAVVIDSRLLEEDRIVCASGDHMHSVLIDPRDLVAAADAHVADICQD